MERLRTRTDGVTITRTSIETNELKDPTQTYTGYPTRPEDMWTQLERVDPEDEEEV